ncbi:hypothetical protein KI387_034643, partial [Taxus chinensis]
MGSLQCLRVGGASVKSSTSLYDTNTSLILCCNTHAISFIPCPNAKTQDSILALTLTPRNRGVVAAVAEEEISVGRKLKIGVYFGTCWALGIAFNIYNKKLLNVFPYPLLSSSLSFIAGSLIMILSWATKIAGAPHTDFDFWMGLAPEAMAHGMGQVGTTVCMSKNDVSFTHVIRSAEPAFIVIFSQIFMGEKRFPLPVYMSLLPIIGGCALAAATQLNCNMIGFAGAMISNMASVMRNNLAKKTMKAKSLSGVNYYACLTILCSIFLTPFAYIVEGPEMWIQGWKTALQTASPRDLL